MFPTLPLFSAENEQAKEGVKTPQSRHWAEGKSTLPLMKFWCILCIQLYVYKTNAFIWQDLCGRRQEKKERQRSMAAKISDRI